MELIVSVFQYRNKIEGERGRELGISERECIRPGGIEAGDCNRCVNMETSAGEDS